MFLSTGDGSLDCRSFRRSSVSRSRASRAWSSCVCEFTASFLTSVSRPRNNEPQFVLGKLTCLLQLD